MLNPNHSVLDEFRSLRWMPLQPKLLDFENTQFIIIGEGVDSIDKATEQSSKDGEQDKDTPLEEMEKLEREDEIRVEHLKGRLRCATFIFFCYTFLIVVFNCYFSFPSPFCFHRGLVGFFKIFPCSLILFLLPPPLSPPLLPPVPFFAFLRLLQLALLFFEFNIDIYIDIHIYNIR